MASRPRSNRCGYVPSLFAPGILTSERALSANSIAILTAALSSQPQVSRLRGPTGRRACSCEHILLLLSRVGDHHADERFDCWEQGYSRASIVAQEGPSVSSTKARNSAGWSL